MMCGVPAAAVLPDPRRTGWGGGRYRFARSTNSGYSSAAAFSKCSK